MSTGSSGVRTQRLLMAVSIVGAALVLWAIDQQTHGQARPPAKPKRVAGQPDLATDLDEAIRLVEAGEFQTFLEKYAPVEILRRMRQEDLVEQAAAALAGRPQSKSQLLTVLRALKEQTPRYDKSRGLATLDFDPFASGVPEAADELHLPAGGDLKLTGLGDDLATVVAQAVKLLQAGDMAAFVEGLFPATEIARLRQGGQMPALLQQFKDSPELQTALLADFKRMQGTKPELADKGQVAIFKLAEEDDQPERTVKLQKTGRDWRLFDDAPRVAAELVREAKLKPQSSLINVQLELIGGNWRFVELPMLPAAPN